LLVSELEPSMTGDSIFPAFLRGLDNCLSPVNPVVNKLNVIEKILRTFEKPGAHAVPVDLYKDLRSHIEKLEIDTGHYPVFQVDVSKPASCAVLPEHFAQKILRGVAFLSRLTVHDPDTRLARFKKRFRERYESLEVPLLMALDREMGISYGENGYHGDIAPLIDDLRLPLRKEQLSIQKWHPVHEMLMLKLIAAASHGQRTIELTDKDIEKFPYHPEYLPDTFYAMVKIFNDKGAKGQDRLFINYAGGSGAGNLLGRFGHTDKAILDHLKTITRKEQELETDAILAEIVHLPESRTGNVLLRPALREYEIAYLARSGLDRPHTIQANNLLLSLRNDRFVLRSPGLNKVIKPRLTTAHNFSGDVLPVYQFLCDMQYQDQPGHVAFSWGPPANYFNFLPRLIYRNMVFSPAQWKVNREEIIDLLNISDPQLLVEQMSKWRKSRAIPDIVLFTEFDNELLLDHNNADSIMILLGRIKSRPDILLCEFLFCTREQLVTDGKNAYSNEIIATFYKSHYDQ